MSTLTTLTLTTEQLTLLRAVLNSADDARGCLCIAEQIGAAYDEEGGFDDQTAARTEQTFDALLSIVRAA